MEIEPPEAPKYLHRLFLQMFLRQPCILEAHLIDNFNKLAAICPGEASRSELELFVQAVNREILDKYNLAIKCVEHPVKSESHYILVNLQADMPSKLATKLKPAEIDIFRKIIGAIAESDSGHISGIDVLNLVPSSVMTKTMFESTILSKLVADSWLEETTGGHYTLGLRTITELRTYLRDQYPDLPTCARCEEPVFIATPCPNDQNVFHRSCLRPRRRCPGCDQEVPLPDNLYPPATQGRTSKRRRCNEPSQTQNDGQEMNDANDE